jgi:hypothetical protein
MIPMKDIKESTDEVMDKVKKVGYAVIWSGTLKEYLETTEADDEGMPEDTPVTLTVIYKNGHYAMRVRYDPDSENEVSYVLGEGSNIDNGFWMMVNSYMNQRE